MTQDEDAIRQIIAARDAAIGAGDADGAVAATAQGATMYDLAPPLASTHAHDAAVAGLAAWFATWDDGVRSALAAPTVRVSGDLAVAWGLARMRGRKDGAAQDMWFRCTLVFARTDTGWRVIHEHSSVPLTMDGSGAAATNLTPEGEQA